MRAPAHHDDILAREREAWDRLQHSREAQTLSQRKRHLDDWLEAVRHLRQTQAERTRHAVAGALAGLRECVPLLGSASAPAAAAAAENPPGFGAALAARSVPHHAECLRARDGTLWRVESVAVDLLDACCFLAHVRRETPAGRLIDIVEIYSDDWPLHCMAYGLQPLATSTGRA